MVGGVPLWSAVAWPGCVTLDCTSVALFGEYTI
jgi:hypothetical protein